MPLKPVRNSVFISYSHTDKKWLDRLRIHLKPLERDHNVVVWSDAKLRSGDDWRTEINEAIASAKVAILLVSADFLASDFITTNELPPLLSAASEEGLVILPIIVSYFAFSLSSLSQYQTVNEPTLPLNAIPKGQAEEVFSKVSQRVYEIFVTPTLRGSVDKTVTDEATKATKPVPEVASNEFVHEGAEMVSLNVAQAADSVSVGASISALDAPHAGHSYSVLLVKSNGDWNILPVISQAQTVRVLSFTLRPATPVQRAFLIALRQYEDLSSIAFRDQAYPCTIKSFRSSIEGNEETWHLEAKVGAINVRPEVIFNRITPNMQAQIRARVLLLDEASLGIGPVFVGMGSYLNIKESPFPALYHLVGKHPAVFNKAARLIATWYLHMSDTVEHIVKLQLALKGQTMTVVFEGKRRAGHDESPAVIRVEGTCDLSRPVAVRTLRLGPLNRY